MSWKLRRRGKVSDETVGDSLRRLNEAYDKMSRQLVDCMIDTGKGLDSVLRTQLDIGVDSDGKYRLSCDDPRFKLDPDTGELSWSPHVYSLSVICEHLHCDRGMVFGPFEYRGERDKLWSQATVLVRQIAHLKNPKDDPWSWCWSALWREISGEELRYAVYVPRDGDGFPVDPWNEFLLESGFADTAAAKWSERQGHQMPEPPKLSSYRGHRVWSDLVVDGRRLGDV